MIVSELLLGSKTFKELKESTRTSDGNLSIQCKHLKTLEIISEEKKFVNSKPQTTYFITKEGKDYFENYVNELLMVLEASKKQEKICETENVDEI